MLTDACAGLGDVECVLKAGARAVSIDGDHGRFHTARAAAALVGKAEVDVDEALREAHRASPFDEKLAAKVGEAVVPGGPAAAARVRAARRALLRHAPKLVDEALAPVAKAPSCRVCRALDAEAAAGVDQAQKAAQALGGEGPPLALADLLVVIDALGAAPDAQARKALDAIRDEREPVVRAVARARADHKDPDDRRRRDAGEGGHDHAPSPAVAPPARAPGASPDKEQKP
jgi:hypothetical protein